MTNKIHRGVYKVNSFESVFVENYSCLRKVSLYTHNIR